MKKILTLSLIAMLAISCQKENSKSNATSNLKQTNSDDLLSNKVVYDHKDTTTIKIYNSKLTLNSIATHLAAHYNGNGNYSFTASISGANKTALLTYVLYKDGAIYATEGTLVSPTVTVSGNFPSGLYYFTIQTTDIGTLNTPSFTVYVEPVAPSGMLCLYRYYNSLSYMHICTYDWEELGSGTDGWAFEKVLAYTYPSASSAPNLKPIYRYYNSSDGSHFTTDILGNYSGFVYEKILGYVGTSETAALTKPLTKWYNSSLDDHFVCVPPDVPISGGYTKDVDFTFGYGQ